MCVEAYGSGGMFKYDLAGGQLLGAQSESEDLHEIVVPPERQGSWQVEADFVAAVRGKKPVSMTSFADGVKYMRFTEAVRLSAVTGQRVALLEV
jgi:predicted dehydrogenase